MRYIAILTLIVVSLSACTTLNKQERDKIAELKYQGITVDKPVGNYEAPANPGVAGALNILPGIGNFYLAAGNAGDSNHYLYGFLNLLFWPISVVWGIPEAAIDASNINKRELVYYVTYDKNGVKSYNEVATQQ